MLTIKSTSVDFKIGDKVTWRVSRSRWSIWRDRFAQWKWDVPTTEMREHVITFMLIRFQHTNAEAY